VRLVDLVNFALQDQVLSGLDRLRDAQEFLGVGLLLHSVILHRLAVMSVFLFAALRSALERHLLWRRGCLCLSVCLSR